jgi:uncharacterized membrane protein
MMLTEDQVVAALAGVLPENQVRALLGAPSSAGNTTRFYLVERKWSSGLKSYHLRKRPGGGRVRMGYCNFTERIAQLPALNELRWRKI